MYIFQREKKHKPNRSDRVVYSAERAAGIVLGSSLEPPPMPAKTSAAMWIKKAWLPCWSLYSQHVSHQRWIWGIHCAQARNPQWFWNPGQRHHQKSKIGVSVAPQKGLMSSKNLKKKRNTEKLIVYCTSFSQDDRLWLIMAPRTRGVRGKSCIFPQLLGTACFLSKNLEKNFSKTFNVGNFRFKQIWTQHREFRTPE